MINRRKAPVEIGKALGKEALQVELLQLLASVNDFQSKRTRKEEAVTKEKKPFFTDCCTSRIVRAGYWTSPRLLASFHLAAVTE